VTVGVALGAGLGVGVSLGGSGEAVDVCEAAGELTAWDSAGGVVAMGPLPEAQADRRSAAKPKTIQRLILFII
jgi:hypothetical protein